MNTFIDTLKCNECGNNPTTWTKQLKHLCKEHGDTIIVLREYLDGNKKGDSDMSIGRLGSMFIDTLSEVKSTEELQMTKERFFYDVEAEIDMASEWAMEQEGWYEVMGMREIKSEKNCRYCEFVKFESDEVEDRDKLMDKKPLVESYGFGLYVNGPELLTVKYGIGYFRVIQRTNIEFCPFCGVNFKEREAE